MMTGPVERPRNLRPWLFVRSLVVWLLLYIVAVYVYNHTYRYAAAWLIGHVQVKPAVALLQPTLPGVTLTLTNTTIRGGNLVLEIQRGCDGIETWLMLVTALLAFPLSWRRRLKGILAGTILVFTLNLARIVSLFHIALQWPAWFDLAHGLIWQAAITVATMVFALMWMTPGGKSTHA